MTKKKYSKKPYIPIDWNTVDYYLQCGCAGTTIAYFLGFKSAKSIYDRCKKERGLSWSEYAALHYSIGDDKLRIAKFEKAVIDKDTKMLIHEDEVRLGNIKRQKADLNINTNIDYNKLNTVYMKLNEEEKLRIYNGDVAYLIKKLQENG